MIKLLIGGSPCTHWSIAQTKNRETEPSGIGWELFENYLIALEKFKPDYFLYENNKSMSAAIMEEITKRLGVEPICINSALVSAQNRQRLYWTNIPGVKQPEDRGILLRDILETGVCWREKSYTLDANYHKTAGAYNPKKQHSCSRLMAAEPINLSFGEKSHTLKAQYAKNGIANFITNGGFDETAVAEPVNVTTDGKSQCLRATYYKDGIRNMVGNDVDRKTCVAEPVRIGTIESETSGSSWDSKQYRVYSPDGKSVTLCGQGGGVGAKTGLYAAPFDCFSQMQSKTTAKQRPIYRVCDGFITSGDKQYPIKLADGFYIIRKLTVNECKRLQTVPDSYVFPVSNTQAYKMLGNGWTVDVIAHILSYCTGITSGPLDVLSMYDGMACGHIALDKLGADIARYRATEIDKYAIKTACHNFPDIEQLGDAYQVREW